MHVTDVTNASRTLLMNLNTLEWDPVRKMNVLLLLCSSINKMDFHLFQELLRLFSIDIDALAKIHPSMHEFGKINNGSGFDNIPICSVR